MKKKLRLRAIMAKVYVGYIFYIGKNMYDMYCNIYSNWVILFDCNKNDIT